MRAPARGSTRSSTNSPPPTASAVNHAETSDRIERARKTVTRRIRDAIARTERAHPPLGRHLQASIRTGVFCSYAPERDVHWTFETH